MRSITLIAAVAALCAAQPALAETTSGFYVGADVGTMSADVDKGGLDAAIEDALLSEGYDFSGTSKSDDSDTTFAVTVGYRFLPYLAVEGQYIDLGSVEYKTSGDVYQVDGPFLGSADVNASIDSSGFGLSVLGILPIESWELFARLGMYFGDTEATAKVAIDDGVDVYSDKLSDSKSEEEMFYGIGAGYSFMDHWNVRVEYTLFDNIGDEKLTGESDVDRIVIGVNYRF